MRFLVLGAALVALLALASTAAGGGSPAFHDHGTDAGVDTNFCGTGESIEFEGRFNVVGWIGETGGDPEQELRVRFNFRFTLTNPETGAAVVDSAAGLVTNEIIAGLESGPHTHLFVESGLRAKLQLAKGRVLTHDAGVLIYTVSFDADDNFTGLEVIKVGGPHPAFESDVWCEAAIDALGIG
jgi:hypothetical protein